MEKIYTNKISIIIPNYNHAQYLSKCLDSVLNQSLIPNEILVIDDASTDNSLDLIRKYTDKHANIRLIANQTNLGAIKAINMGLREVNTDFIIFLAADDWLLPNIVEESLALLTKFPNAGLCSSLSLRCINNVENVLLPIQTAIPIDTGYIMPKQVIEKLMKYDSWFMGNTVVLNRKAALHFNGFRPELHSFTDNFLYRQIALKYGCCFIKKPLSVWRILATSYAHETSKNYSLLEEIMNNAITLMTTEYANIFPRELVNRFKQRMLFSLAVVAAAVPMSKHNGTRFLAFVKKCLLFLYYRPFDIWQVIVRKIYWLCNTTYSEK